MASVPLFAVFFYTLHIVAGADPCGRWTKLSSSCFLFSDFQVSWPEALMVCKAFNSTLVSVDSYEKNLMLEGYLQIRHPHDSDKTTVRYWTGGNDIESEGNYYWIGTDQRLVYTNWNPGQPESDIEDCLSMLGSTNFQWHDVNCNFKEYFICEKPMELSTSPSIIG
ncbi:hepatic lectin-like [Saccostrea cucullata]|uniref:hepatic lectin-like n=1 Tax=Saccostrea cuccullata TaxID=36930 RepID=UPI002ED2DCEC